MSDLLELLSGTTPAVDPVDVELIARTARRRGRRRRIGLASSAVVVAVALVAVTSNVDRGQDLVLTSPAGAQLTAPIGRWRELAPSSLSARSGAFVAALDDGRVLVWGGHAGIGSDDGSAGLRDGAVYDPTSDAWTEIPDAPMPVPTLPGMWIQVANDRLMVVAPDAHGQLYAAMYDVDANEWTELPAQDRVRVVVDGAGWTGETLALVRVDPGGPELGGNEADAWEIDEPVTLRWSVGDTEWTEGAVPPLSMRATSGSAFDGDRIAVWGGSTTRIWADGDVQDPGPDPGSVGDGAVYDVTADEWTMLPPSPLTPRSNPSVDWVDGRLLVGGGHDRFADAGEIDSTAAAFEPETETWSPLPAPPSAGSGANRSSDMRYSPRDDRGFWTRHSREGHSGPQPLWFLAPGGWEEAPLNDLHRWGDLVIATSVTNDNPDAGRFEAKVLAAAGQWLDVADAPFGNRMDAAVVVVDDRLFVLQGAEGRDLVDTPDAWMLDLDVSADR